MRDHKALAVSVTASSEYPQGRLLIYPRTHGYTIGEDRSLTVALPGGPAAHLPAEFTSSEWEAVVGAKNRNELYDRIGDIRLNFPVPTP